MGRFYVHIAGIVARMSGFVYIIPTLRGGANLGNYGEKHLQG